ncbi:phosphocholine-specific phospholipase C [Achromobacter aloeverae]
MNRRDLLKFAGLSGAAGAANMLPAAVRRAFAIAPDPGTSYLDAEHVVILMQENRSFDHMFGTLQGVRGYGDPRAMRLPDGNPVFLQSGAAGESYLPWRLNIRDTRATWMGSIPHTRDSQVDAWNEGRHDRWIDVKKSHRKAYARYPLTMGYYTREDLPFYYALADAFTICDQYHAGAMTSTTPNRLIFWTGTVRDRQAADSSVYMRNAEILRGGMKWTTFPERLEDAGVSWKFYQNEISRTGGMKGHERAWLSNFSCNVLECFDNYQVAAYPGFREWVDEHIKDGQDHLEKLAKQEMLDAGTRTEQLAEAHALLDALMREKNAPLRTPAQLTPRQRALFDKAFVSNRADKHYRKLEKISLPGGGKSMEAPRGDVLHQFRHDVRNGKLPTVSWLAAPEHFSDHPQSPWYGAWYVSAVMDILTADPEIWKKTVFIIAYDENDGYFDHGCTYAAPDPRRPETGRSSAAIGPDGLEYTGREDEIALGVPARLARGGPIGLGFRVPMIVASPWSRGGWVNSQLFEHTSTLRFLETFIARKFGKQVTETNISPWRRAISGDLTSCFRPYDGREPKLPVLDRDTYFQEIEDAREQPLPGGFRALDAEAIAALRAQPGRLRETVRQEPGTRPSCALPYELYADGGLAPDGRQVRLRFKAGRAIFGERSAGAPFNVHRHGLSREGGMQAGTYAVAAGDALDVAFDAAEFAAGRYDVIVHAPNGFYRRFKGRRTGIALDVACAAAPADGHGLALRLTQHGPRTIEVHCAMAGQETRVLRLAPGSTQEAVFDLAPTAMWYDVAITSPADAELMYALAGRIETGKPGSTDPAMGR